MVIIPLRHRRTGNSSATKVIYHFHNTDDQVDARGRVVGIGSAQPAPQQVDVAKEVAKAIADFKRELELKELKREKKELEEKVEKLKEEGKHAATLSKLARVGGLILAGRNDTASKMAGAALLGMTEPEPTEKKKVGSTKQQPEQEDEDDETDDDMQDQERFEEVLNELQEKGVTDDQVIAANEVMLSLVEKIGVEKTAAVLDKIGGLHG